VAEATARSGQVGQDLLNVALDIKKRDDIRAAKDALYEAQKKVRALMYDPEEGIMNRQGHDALGISKTTQSEIERIHQESLAQLGNGTQRDLFNGFFRQSSGVALDRAFKHESDQKHVAEVATTKATIQQAKEDAFDTFDDPDAWQANVEMLRAHVRGLARLQGLDDKTATAMVEEQLTALHDWTVRRLVSEGTPGMAKKYLEEHAGEIGGEVEKGLVGLVSKATRSAEAYDIAVDLTGRYPGGDAADYDRLLRGRLGDDSELIRESMGWIGTFERWRNKETARERESTVSRFTLAAESAQSPEELRVLQLQAKALSDPETSANALRAVNSVVDGRNTVTDAATYDQAMNSILAGEAVNVDDLAFKLAREDRKYLKDLQQSQSKSVLEEISRDYKDYGVKKRDRTIFNSRLLERVNAYRAANGGKEPSPEDIRRMAAILGMEVVTEGGMIFDTEKPRYNLTEEDIVEFNESVEFDDIPENHQRYLLHVARVHGVDVNTFWRKAYISGSYMDSRAWRHFQRTGKLMAPNSVVGEASNEPIQVEE
jgi:hypothetical protein